jgi:hypothetical protein
MQQRIRREYIKSANYPNTLIAEIRTLNNKLMTMTDWDDFVVFKGRKYGHVNTMTRNFIHIEDNCNGLCVYHSSTLEDDSIDSYDDSIITHDPEIYYICQNCNTLHFKYF